MTRLSFRIDGEPQPWRRARTSGRRFFKDARTREYEDAWAVSALVAMGDRKPFDGPLSMTVVANFRQPKRPKIGARHAWPTKRPDADNVAKNMDALNGVAWKDDSQVVALMVFKRWALTGEQPCVTITIEEM